MRGGGRPSLVRKREGRLADGARVSRRAPGAWTGGGAAGGGGAGTQRWSTAGLAAHRSRARDGGAFETPLRATARDELDGASAEPGRAWRAGGGPSDEAMSLAPRVFPRLALCLSHAAGQGRGSGSGGRARRAQSRR